jgi:hypothetical protein
MPAEKTKTETRGNADENRENTVMPEMPSAGVLEFVDDGY